MMFLPAGLFLTIPLPPGLLAALLFAAVILPPLLIFAIFVSSVIIHHRSSCIQAKQAITSFSAFVNASVFAVASARAYSKPSFTFALSAAGMSITLSHWFMFWT